MRCIAGLAIGLLALQFTLSNTVLAEVKNGQKLLICNNKLIAPGMVKDFQDGVWFFTNGYAKNCEVIGSVEA